MCERGEVVFGRLADSGVAIRIRPADGGDADAEHLPGQSEEFDVDSRSAGAGLAEVGEVCLERAAAARFEVDPTQPGGR